MHNCSQPLSEAVWTQHLGTHTFYLAWGTTVNSTKGREKWPTFWEHPVEFLVVVLSFEWCSYGLVFVLLLVPKYVDVHRCVVTQVHTTSSAHTYEYY